MAVLPNADRLRVWRGAMRYWSNLREGIPGVDKSGLLATVNAIDDYADANSASFNAALPAAFRNNATPAQKAFLFALVLLARYAPDFVRRALGVETD